MTEPGGQDPEMGTGEAQAGEPERQSLRSAAFEETVGPTAAQLDARQAAIGERRRRGPELGEGEESAARAAPLAQAESTAPTPCADAPPEGDAQSSESE